MDNKALILAGHGSSRNPNSARLTLNLVDAIRRKGLFTEVHAAFVKQAPYLRDVIRAIETPNVCVVPNMTCKGYITCELIPRQLGEGAASGQRIVQTDPVGTDPRIARALAKKITGLMSDNTLLSEDTAVLLIGHGSQRSRQSHKETHVLAERLASRGVSAAIHPVFLEEPPRVGEWKGLSGAKHIIAAPFLISAGLHGGEDIPALLGLEPNSPELSGKSGSAAGPFIVDERKVWLLPAIGGDAVVLEIIIGRAKGA